MGVRYNLPRITFLEHFAKIKQITIPEIKIFPDLSLSFQEKMTSKIQENIRSLRKKIGEELISRIEKNPNLLFSSKVSELTRICLEISPEEEKLAKEVLNEFSKSRWGAPMSEETQEFLINELLYLVLKIEQEGQL